jgi:hypothetical protein
MVENMSFENLKRRNQNKEFSFPFFVGSSPDPSTEEGVVRKNSLVLVPSGARQRGAQTHHAIGAYDTVQSHHARGACEDQSLCDCLEKKVRAKVSNSSQKETSNEVNERAKAARAEEAKHPFGKLPVFLTFATNWDGTGAPKRADLSLVSYLKAI